MNRRFAVDHGEQRRVSVSAFYDSVSITGDV